MKIFAIEFTNWCNAKCDFCPYPSPAHTRQKGYMTHKTLDRIIEIISPPKRINISGLGEPLLHQKCIQFIKALSKAGIETQINTNGFFLNQGIYNRLAKAGLKRLVITSDYFPWKKGKIKVKDELPVTLFTITREPDVPELGQTRKPLDDWGGQVGRVDRKDVPCSFLTGNFFQITWDGKIQRCCVDFNAEHTIGDIWHRQLVESIDQFTDKGIPLCQGCHGYVFKDGIVAGDYEGEGITPPDAFKV